MPVKVRYEVEARLWGGGSWAVNRIGKRGGKKNIAVYDNESTANAVMRTLNAYREDER